MEGSEAYRKGFVARREPSEGNEEVVMLPHKTLEEFALENAALTEGDFRQKHDSPFLVVNLDGGVPELSGRLVCATTALDEDSDGNPYRPSFLDSRRRVLMAPVMKTPRNRFAQMITVGRTDQNDIVIPARSISKFHAYFQRNKDSGAMMIVDGGSKFGTVLEGDAVHEGQARELHNGGTIVFAKVARSTFLLPEFVYGYVQLNLRILEKWKANPESV
jgi:hypothetical protein